MSIIMVLDGEIEVEHKQYSVTYTVDAMTHPFFNTVSDNDLALLIFNWNRRDGAKLTCGGSSGWTPEQFLESILHSRDFVKSFEEVLCEDNYISQFFGIDPEIAAERLKRHRLLKLDEARDAVFGDEINSCSICGRQQCATFYGADCPVMEWAERNQDDRPMRFIRRDYWKRYG